MCPESGTGPKKSPLSHRRHHHGERRHLLGFQGCSTSGRGPPLTHPPAPLVSGVRAGSLGPLYATAPYIYSSLRRWLRWGGDGWRWQVRWCRWGERGDVGAWFRRRAACGCFKGWVAPLEAFTGRSHHNLHAGLQCVLFYKCGLIYFSGFICSGVYAFGRQLVCLMPCWCLDLYSVCVCVCVCVCVRAHSNNWTCCSVFYENLQDTNASASNKHISFLSKRQASCVVEPWEIVEVPQITFNTVTSCMTLRNLKVPLMLWYVMSFHMHGESKVIENLCHYLLTVMSFQSFCRAQNIYIFPVHTMQNY